jgi:hypothetical protein
MRKSGTFYFLVFCFSGFFARSMEGAAHVLRRGMQVILEGKPLPQFSDLALDYHWWPWAFVLIYIVCAIGSLTYKSWEKTSCPRPSMPLACRTLDDVYGGHCISLAMDHFIRIHSRKRVSRLINRRTIHPTQPPVAFGSRRLVGVDAPTSPSEATGLRGSAGGRCRI